MAGFPSQDASIAQQDRALADLVGAVADGDAGAFDQLHRTLRRSVIATIMRILRDPWQSDEVAQEVFLEVWQKAAQFDSRRGTARGWVLALAGRRAIDRVRASQAARDRDARSAVRNIDRPRDQVWERVESLHEGAQLHKALTRLTPLQREALTVTYLHGRSVAEAAEQLGASETALRTRMRDGLIGLRRMLSGLDLAA